MSLFHEILRYLGYKNQNVDEVVTKQINKYIEFFQKNVKPKYMYRIFDVEVNEFISLKNTNVNFVGKDIYNHLKNASKCAVMAATLGAESERILNLLSKTKISEAIIFDAVCTAKIEEICDLCEEEIKSQVLKEGLYTNYRYSPGYGDFPLDSQKAITSILGCHKGIGLTVTDSDLLIPRKSVTALIGIFEDKQNGYKKDCDLCGLSETCTYKKKGITCREDDKDEF